MSRTTDERLARLERIVDNLVAHNMVTVDAQDDVDALSDDIAGAPRGTTKRERRDQQAFRDRIAGRERP